MSAYKGASRPDLATGKSPKWHTCEACRELKGHDNWSTTRQNIQSGQAVSSRLNLATCSTHETESPDRMPYLDEN